MVKKERTVKRLRVEADYEEKLSKNLTNYFLDSIDDISELNTQEKKKIIEFITHIRDESIDHQHLFEELITGVLNSEKDNF